MRDRTRHRCWESSQRHWIWKFIDRWHDSRRQCNELWWILWYESRRWRDVGRRWWRRGWSWWSWSWDWVLTAWIQRGGWRWDVQWRWRGWVWIFRSIWRTKSRAKRRAVRRRIATLDPRLTPTSWIVALEHYQQRNEYWWQRHAWEWNVLLTSNERH